MTTSNIRIVPDLDSKFGLVGWLNEQRVSLPLKGIATRFHVCGGLVEVELDQIYHQDNRSPIDCQYLFPLPATAAVYRCEVQINDRLLVAKTMRLDDAINLVNEKKVKGHRTALVESERDNLFTLSLGNLQPGDLIVVRLAYLQPLAQLGALRSVEIPLCPGVRYIPGSHLLRANNGPGPEDDTDAVPDASRITTPRIDQFHPDAAYVDIQGCLDVETVQTETVASPSHGIVTTENGANLTVALLQKNAVPDRSFVIRWHERKLAAFKPRGWRHFHNGYTYALLELRAPQATSKTPVQPSDNYFLLDRSGSMRGDKWTKAIEALRTSLERLQPQDRVWLTVFESSFSDYDTQLVSPARMLSDQTLWNDLANGVMGGTNLLPALQHVIEQTQRLAGPNPAQLLLLTDAQVGNDDEIGRLVSKRSNLRIHCFGLDYALNDALLESLARSSGGTFHSLSPNDDIVARVSEIAVMLTQPVLSGIAVPAGWESPDKAIPTLYSGQIQILALRHRGQATEITLTGRDPADHPSDFTFPLTKTDRPGPYLHWCRRELDRLRSENYTETAVQLSEESNLICRATAFVAWDAHEKVARADQQLVQPAQTPADNSMGHLESPLAMHYRVSCQASYHAHYAPDRSERRSTLARFFSQSHNPTDDFSELTALNEIFAAMDRHLASQSPITLADRELILKKVSQIAGRLQLAGLMDALRSEVRELRRLEKILHQLTAKSQSPSILAPIRQLRLQRLKAQIECLLVRCAGHLLKILP